LPFNIRLDVVEIDRSRDIPMKVTRPSPGLLTYDDYDDNMSSAPPSGPPSDPPPNPEKQPETQPTSSASAPATQDAAAMDTTPDQVPEENWDDIPADIMSLGTDEILTRIRLIENDIKVCFF